MTRKLFALACLIPMLGLTLVSEEAQARSCCKRSRNCCNVQHNQCGFQVGHQQPVIQEPVFQQASYQQSTCCQPRATCCGAQSACAIQGQTNGYAPAPQSPPVDQAAPAPPQEPATAPAPAPQPEN